MRSSQMQRRGTATFIKGTDNAHPPFKCGCSVSGRPRTPDAVVNSWSGYATTRFTGLFFSSV
ncbi:hypothetical protein Bca101_056968 [Brassica carinata]